MKFTITNKKISFAGSLLTALLVFGFGAAVIIPQNNVSAQERECVAGKIDAGLILDRSGSMSGGKLDAAKDAARGFVTVLDEGGVSNYISITSYAGASSLDASLTANRSIVRNAIDSLNASGMTNIYAGINTAHNDFINNARFEASQVFVLMSDGKANKPDGASTASQMAIDAAQAAKEDGIIIYTIAFGEYADVGLLQTLASSQSHFYTAGFTTNLGTSGSYDYDLRKVYERIGRRICLGTINGIVFDDSNGDGELNDGELNSSAGEEGIPDRRAKLMAGGVLYDQATTSEEGLFGFSDVEAPGRYEVIMNDILEDENRTYPPEPHSYDVELDADGDLSVLTPSDHTGEQLRFGLLSGAIANIEARKVPSGTYKDDSLSIDETDEFEVKWDSENADICTYNFGAGSGLSGTHSSSSPAIGTHTFEITCEDPVGTTSDSVDVNVGDVVPWVNLTANPSAVPHDSTTTLEWTSSNVSGCSATGGAGFTTGGRANGTDESAVLTNTSTTTDAIETFTIECAGDDGAIATSSADVTIEPEIEPSVTLTANPSAVPHDSTTELTWSSSDVSGCSATEGAGFTTGGNTNGTDESAVLTNTGTASTTETFTIQCDGTDGTIVTSSADVTIEPEDAGDIEPSVTLTADPSAVPHDSTTELTWSSSDVSRCSATEGAGFNTGGRANGTDESAVLTNTSTTTDAIETFTIECAGDDGTIATSSADVTIRPEGANISGSLSCDITRNGSSISQIEVNTEFQLEVVPSGLPNDLETSKNYIIKWSIIEDGTTSELGTRTPSDSDFNLTYSSPTVGDKVFTAELIPDVSSTFAGASLQCRKLLDVIVNPQYIER